MKLTFAIIQQCKVLNPYRRR